MERWAGHIFTCVVVPTIESLLEDWRDGKYFEVANVLHSMPPKSAVKFCELLVKYEGVGQVVILNKLMD